MNDWAWTKSGPESYVTEASTLGTLHEKTELPDGSLYRDHNWQVVYNENHEVVQWVARTPSGLTFTIFND